MTETNRYKNGKIYKIISPHTNKIYVGSTCKKYLCQRLGCHKDGYKRWLKDNNNGYTSSYVLFDLGDVEIILLEIVNCNTKDELLKKEREWIEKYKDIIVNRLKPITTKEEKKKNVKQYDKEHKEEKKQYYEKNKEEHKQYSKEYYKEHKEKIKEYSKEQILCDCGVSFQKTSKARHIGRQTHQQYINSLVSKSVLKT
jgi:hypothetical protein